MLFEPYFVFNNGGIIKELKYNNDLLKILRRFSVLLLKCKRRRSLNRPHFPDPYQQIPLVREVAWTTLRVVLVWVCIAVQKSLSIII